MYARPGALGPRGRRGFCWETRQPGPVAALPQADGALQHIDDVGLLAGAVGQAQVVELAPLLGTQQADRFSALLEDAAALISINTSAPRAVDRRMASSKGIFSSP